VAFALIAIDRHFTRLDDQTILTWMSCGGFCGGKVAMTLLDHKTFQKNFVQQSESHRILLNNIALLAVYYL
jgi:uncharacterized membrane protein YsdA (DUF1294 family)